MKQPVNRFQELRDKINKLEGTKTCFSKSFTGVLFDPPPLHVFEHLRCDKLPDLQQPVNQSINQPIIVEQSLPLQCEKCSPELIADNGQNLHKSYNDNFSNTKILFVADFPKGLQNSLFSPESEALFNKITTAMKLEKDEFHTTSIVRCRPALELKENYLKLASNCLAKLYQEILFFKPEVVVTLGATPINLMLETEERLTNIHGKFFSRRITNHEKQEFNYKLVPIFHPDFLLINPNMKKTTWIDLKRVLEYIEK